VVEDGVVVEGVGAGVGLGDFSTNQTDPIWTDADDDDDDDGLLLSGSFMPSSIRFSLDL
jgi:hypothetical protein